MSELRIRRVSPSRRRGTPSLCDDMQVRNVLERTATANAPEHSVTPRDGEEEISVHRSSIRWASTSVSVSEANVCPSAAV